MVGEGPEECVLVDVKKGDTLKMVENGQRWKESQRLQVEKTGNVHWSWPWSLATAISPEE